MQSTRGRKENSGKCSSDLDELTPYKPTTSPGSVARRQILPKASLLAPSQRGSKHENEEVTLVTNPDSQPVLSKDAE